MTAAPLEQHSLEPNEVKKKKKRPKKRQRWNKKRPKKSQRWKKKRPKKSSSLLSHGWRVASPTDPGGDVGPGRNTPPRVIGA